MVHVTIYMGKKHFGGRKSLYQTAYRQHVKQLTVLKSLPKELSESHVMLLFCGVLTSCGAPCRRGAAEAWRGGRAGLV